MCLARWTKEEEMEIEPGSNNVVSPRCASARARGRGSGPMLVNPSWSTSRVRFSGATRSVACAAPPPGRATPRPQGTVPGGRLDASAVAAFWRSGGSRPGVSLPAGASPP